MPFTNHSARRIASAVAVTVMLAIGAGCRDESDGEADDTTVPADTTPPAGTTADTSAPTSLPPTSATPSSAPEGPPTSPSTSAVEGALDPVAVRLPPATANGPANASTLDLGAVGYIEEEFFFDGDAAAFSLTSERTLDGEWTAEESETAPFTSRMLVRRPSADATFSGVVVVEWFNVSGGVDGEPDWGYNSDEIIREGHAWVGVSAQSVGVVGSEESFAGLEGALVNADPERYGELVHPGDRFSFDIFTQAGRALVAPDGPAPLGPLQAATLIAIGESQSGMFLSSYANGVQPLANLFDGILIHSRGGGIPSLDEGILGAVDDPVTIRTDLDVPVLVFETETDMNVLGYAASRQDDSDTVRVWEVAGAAHADSFLLEGVYGDAAQGIVGACAGLINDGPQFQVLRAALHHFVNWVLDGTEPPESPRLDVEVDDASPFGFVIRRDELGNAIGGIRTPAVDVPISALSGDPIPGSPGFCQIFGSTAPFEAAQLTELYGDPAAYIARFEVSLQGAVDAGFVLGPEAEVWRQQAAAFTW